MILTELSLSLSLRLLGPDKWSPQVFKTGRRDALQENVTMMDGEHVSLNGSKVIQEGKGQIGP